MVDKKVINILETMYQAEREQIGTENTKLDYTHGDKAEALNNAIFLYKNINEFYINKDTLRDIKEGLELKLKVYRQGNIELTEIQKYELGAELSLINELLQEV